MNTLWSFISQYWEYIIAGVCYLVLLIISILKKKVKVVDNQLTAILVRLPSIISEAEKEFPSSGSGSTKFQFVLQVALKMICAESDLTIDEAAKKYSSKLTSAIEDILSTPTKKGD